MRKVRTTMQPSQEIEVDDREFESLRNMGILVGEDTSPPGSAVEIVEAEQPAKEEADQGDEGSSSTRSGKRSGTSK